MLGGCLPRKKISRLLSVEPQVSCVILADAFRESISALASVLWTMRMIRVLHLEMVYVQSST